MGKDRICQCLGGIVIASLSLPVIASLSLPVIAVSRSPERSEGGSVAILVANEVKQSRKA